MSKTEKATSVLRLELRWKNRKSTRENGVKLFDSGKRRQDLPAVVTGLSWRRQDRFVRHVYPEVDSTNNQAFAVKLMTGRFIGDYSNQSELMYRDTGKILNDAKVNTIEVMDTSSKVTFISQLHFNHLAKQYQTSKFNELILWCDAVVIIYSICDHSSFAEAQRLKITAKMMRREHRLIEVWFELK